MLIKYVLPGINGNHKDKEPTKVLVAKITERKKLQKIDWKFRIMWEPTNGAYLCGVNKKNIEKKFQFGNYVLWFPKGKKHIWENSRKDGLVHSR
jgi:hypothetical protein